MSGFVRRIPEGDNRERMVCAECGHIAYENPKVVVGAVVVADGAVLLCRRAIEPRHGFWTLPAGYLELGETLQEGAAREIFEEARARVAFDGILGIFSISRIGQVHVMFRARFADEGGSPRFAAGVESLEVGLFGWNDIPWARLAFPSVRWTLDAGCLAPEWQRPARRSGRQPGSRPARDAAARGAADHLADAMRMKRISHLLVALPLILGAAPLQSGRLIVPVAQLPGDPKPLPGRAKPLPGHAKPLPVHARPFPVPPIPPAHPPTDGPAPTPDQDATAPPAPESDGPKFTPTIVRAPTFHNGYDPSFGYVNGSRWQDDPAEDRRVMPSPGFNFEIPFK